MTTALSRAAQEPGDPRFHACFRLDVRIGATLLEPFPVTEMPLGAGGRTPYRWRAQAVSGPIRDLLDQDHRQPEVDGLGSTT